MCQYRLKIAFLLTIFVMVVSLVTNGQEVETHDTTKVEITTSKTQGSDIIPDTLQQKNDVSPMDIPSNRGLFIISPDHMMQMRILGSVRAVFNYTDQVLSNKNTFNPYEIPTNGNSISPNYYAGLSQTRIGFEVTRRTKKAGDVFIRIEADFANSVNSFRIRHAYGQAGHFLVGQTWSLFNNVSAQPATVSLSGPLGSIYIRTPQIRYFRSVNNITWYVGIEYSTPDFAIPDSLKGQLLQVVPDFTGKIRYKSGQFTSHFAAIVTTMSGKDTTDKIGYEFGFGVSVAGKFVINKKNDIYFSIASGRGISHYFDALRGKDEDAAYNSVNQTLAVLFSTGGYVAYGRNLPLNLSTNLSFGIVAISNKDFQPANAYSHSYNVMLNVFWQPMGGARFGFEYAYGQRYDKGGAKGKATQFSMLLYYDF